MSLIFVSYSSKDRDLISGLLNDLEMLGYEIWFDAELTRSGGHKWWANILENLRRSDLMIFALTPNSLESEACKREYSYGYALGKWILPVMLQSVDVSLLPVALQETQFVDYRERSSRQGIALSTSLNNLPPPRLMPNPLPPEPETPLTPLARLSERLDASTLSSSDQIAIIFELETLRNDADTRAGADTLLRRLYEREDLTNRVGDKIRAMLDLGRGQLPSPSPVSNIPVQDTPAKVENPQVVKAVATAGGGQRERGRWLSVYLVVCAVVSIICLLGFQDFRINGYPGDFALGVSAIASLIGIYFILRWRKLGFYLVSGGLIAGTLSAVVIDTYYGNALSNKFFLITIGVVLLFALLLIRRVKWAIFE